MSSLVTDKNSDEKNTPRVRFKWEARESSSPPPEEMLKRKSPITGRTSPPNVGAPKTKGSVVVINPRPKPQVFTTNWKEKHNKGGKKTRKKRKTRGKKRKTRGKKRKTRGKKRKTRGKKRKTRGKKIRKTS
jgi:hypothetical protein